MSAAKGIYHGFHYLDIKVLALHMDCGEPVFRSQCRTLTDTPIPARIRWCEPGVLHQAEFDYPDGNCFLIQNFNIAFFFSIMKNKRGKTIHWVWTLLVYEIRGMRGKWMPGLGQLPAARCLAGSAAHSRSGRDGPETQPPLWPVLGEL